MKINCLQRFKHPLFHDADANFEGLLRCGERYSRRTPASLTSLAYLATSAIM